MMKLPEKLRRTLLIDKDTEEYQCCTKNSYIPLSLLTSKNLEECNSALVFIERKVLGMGDNIDDCE